jgi:acylphosphatase
MANVRAHVFINGLVQGVFFRQKIKQLAESRGVTGWVRNLDDGRVEAVFEGEEADVAVLVDFCRKGPRGAVVAGVDVTSEEFTGEFQDFKVTY